MLRRPRHVDHDGRAVEFGADHLRSYGALPDQVVEFLFGRGAFDRLAVDIRRADGLVRLLGLLALGQFLLREVYGVGTHVGDETLLVEVLGDGHRLRNGHAQLAARLLLERRGRERRCRETLCGFLFGFRHGECGADATAEECLGLGLRFEARREFGLEDGLFGVVGRVELCHDAEIGCRAEGDDLALALDDQPYGDALHAARRQRRPHLLP